MAESLTIKDSPTDGTFPDADETEMSFGEPLRVSVTRGTSRFESIQRTLSKHASTHNDDEERTAGSSAFDLAAWLTGRRQQDQPPFPNRVGLAFSDISVFGDPIGDHHIATLASPIRQLIESAPRGFGIPELFQKQTSYRQLTHALSGLVRDGEMLLVLGRPDSGCSTLLRVLGNRRGGFQRIDGTVSYGGLQPDEVNKAYRGLVAYNSEEDYHYASLTVRQTLRFAIQCKIPSTRVLQNRDDYTSEFLDALLEMYGLINCADTPVSAISGGESKRLSLAEQTAAGAAVDVWQASTTGLDSSSALDYARSLRVTTDVLHKATVAALNQTSEDIYQLFDKVLVVDEGRQLYFGSTTDAVSYFEALGISKSPRQTTADFLTRVTQLRERRLVDGFAGKVPQTAEDFERAWRASSQHRDLEQQLAAFASQVAEDKRSGEIRDFVNHSKMGQRARSPYISTFGFQARLLLRRQLLIAWGARAEHALVFFTYCAFAALTALSFMNLEADSESVRIRGSLLFLILSFVALAEESTVPKTLENRRVNLKHKRGAYFHPAALTLVEALLDLVLGAIKCLLFAVIVYFATEMVGTAGHFFTFYLQLATLCACMVAFFRSLGLALPTVDIALTVSGVTLLLWITLSGYMQSTGGMRVYMRWISFVNPLAWSMRGLLADQLGAVDIVCSGTNLVPSGPGFDNIAYQVCTLAGALPGQLTVRGADYLSQSMQVYVEDKWRRYYVAVVGFWLLFVALSAVASEYIEYDIMVGSAIVSKRRKTAVEPLTEDLVSDRASSVGENKLASKSGDKTSLSITPDTNGSSFTWKYLNYTVPAKGGDRQLLDNISGYIKPKTLTALMGSSGAGKTTLLDALSQRISAGRLRGEMLLAGMPLPRSFRRSTGYSEQQDVHASLITVREALRFSARLRQPASVPDVDKFAYVERVIRLLELDDIADCLVGDPDSGSGISLAQRKLLSIGVEIVAKPKILFLDEPTSPCGEAASFRIISILRRLAVEEELTIILSLHQPSSLLFDQIDRLLLLVRGGHPVYFGDIGDDAHTLINYFERNGAPKCPPTANPAEYILDVVGASDIDWPQAWRDSPELHSTLVEIDRINQTCRAECTFDLADSARRFARSHTYQFHLVARRMLLMYWRNTDYLMTNLALQLIGGLVLGLAFLQIKSGTGGLLQMTYACFMAACLCVFTANQVIPEFIRQRRVFIRESATNQYGAAAFVCSCVAIELPFLVSTSTIFFVVFYFMTGFSTTSARVAFFWLQYIVLAIHSLTLGQAMSAISKTESVAAMLSPLATTVFALYSSALIPVDMLPGVWRYTLRWLSPYFYWLEAVVSDQLHDIQVRCRPEELFTFDPPANMTCGEYAGEWVKSAIGYIDNLDSASECRYCPYRVGDEYYQSFSWEYTHRWRNLGILLGFIAANIVITALAIKFIKYSRR